MHTHGVTLRSLGALRGPNRYATMPVLLAELDIGPYEQRPSSSFPGFVERLTAWLPGLEAHTCSWSARSRSEPGCGTMGSPTVRTYSERSP